jgi:hypothetical protein
MMIWVSVSLIRELIPLKLELLGGCVHARNS